MTKQTLKLKKIEDSKRDYMELLLLADEQEDMIMKYLDRGTLFAAYDENLLVGVCVVTEEKETYGAGGYEIKNLAVKEQLQRRGYGKKILEEIENRYRECCKVLYVGTGDSPLTVYEIKNLAVKEQLQRRGYGKKILEEIENRYRECCKVLYVGTGDSPLTVPFYKSCGYAESHRVKNFFTDHYDHPIVEAGVVLRDMVYFCKKI